MNKYQNLFSVCSPSIIRPSYQTPTNIINPNQSKRSHSLNRQNSQPKLFKKNIDNYSEKKSQQRYYQLSINRNKNNQQYDLQYTNILDIINLLEVGNQKIQSVTYSQLIQFLYLLGYIQYPKQDKYISDKEREQLKKVYQIWVSLSKDSIILKINILQFVLILEGINIQNQQLLKIIKSIQQHTGNKYLQYYLHHNKDDDKQKIIDNPKLIFFIKKKNYLFDQNGNVNLDNERDNIRKNYQIFIKNKNNSLKGSLKNKQRNISNKTHQKTNCYIKFDKERSQTYQFQNQKDSISQSQDSNKEINNKKNRLGNAFRQNKQFMNIDLESLSKPKEKSRNKRSDEIQFQRDEQQYTFHPLVRNYRGNSTSKQKLTQKIKNADKVMYRMKQARLMKQQKQTLMKTGWTNNTNIKSDKKVIDLKQLTKNKTSKKQKVILLKANIQKQNIPFECRRKINFQEGLSLNQKNISKKINQQKISKQVDLVPVCVNSPQQQTKNSIKNQQFKIPILFIDVNIQQGKKQRIVIFDGDRAEELAHTFGKRHKLDQQTIKRLQQMLKQQINSVLSRIDQQAQEESSLIF